MNYSVLMSLYIKENPKNLKRAIDSMINQTFKPSEIVIVKDGQITSELQNVLDFYENKYPCLFKIVGYSENKGLGFALNYGLQNCSFELVARMDTDDISRENRCEQQLKILKDHPEIDIVGGDIAEFAENENNIIGERRVPIDDKEIKDFMKKRCPFNHMTVMFKKKSVLNAGNYQEWFWNEDYYLWIRMFENDCRFMNTGTVLVDVRTGNDMFSRRGGKKYYNSEVMLQNYMLQHHIITYSTYIKNRLKRLIVQRILPVLFRGWIYKKFARAKYRRENIRNEK